MTCCVLSAAPSTLQVLSKQRLRYYFSSSCKLLTVLCICTQRNGNTREARRSLLERERQWCGGLWEAGDRKPLPGVGGGVFLGELGQSVGFSKGTRLGGVGMSRKGQEGCFVGGGKRERIVSRVVTCVKPKHHLRQRMEGQVQKEQCQCPRATGYKPRSVCRCRPSSGRPGEGLGVGAERNRVGQEKKRGQ